MSPQEISALLGTQLTAEDNNEVERELDEILKEVRHLVFFFFFFALPSLSFNLKSSSSFLFFFSTCSKRKTSQRRFPRCPHTNLRQQRAKVTQVGSTQQKRQGWKIDIDTLFMKSRQNQRRKRESRRSWSQREGISSHRVVCCKRRKKTKKKRKKKKEKKLLLLQMDSEQDTPTTPAKEEEEKEEKEEEGEVFTVEDDEGPERALSEKEAKEMAEGFLGHLLPMLEQISAKLLELE